MHTFKRISLLCCLILFTFSCEEKPEEVKIIDHNFLDALIEQGVDTNADGIISPDEAEAVSKLELNGKGIINMNGIEAFINLDTLYCESNQFTWINLSECRKLRVLYCSHGRLQTLDVSNNPLLVDLACERNVDLRELDVSNHPQLFYLNCQYCGLTSLNITGAESLEILMSEMNRMTHIDFSTNPKLRWLFFAFCDLESVDLSSLEKLNWAYFQGNQIQTATLGYHPQLEELGLGMNHLTEIDLSGCTALRKLAIHTNQLSSLNLSSNSNLGTGLNESHGCYLEIGNMPTLEEVCVWTEPFPPDGFLVCMDGSPNVDFTTNCASYSLKIKNNQVIGSF